MKRKWILLGAAGLLLAAGIVWGQLKAVRDDAGDTAYQSISGEGQLIEGTMDAYGRLWVNIGSGTAGTQAEDAAHASTDVGVFSLAVRNDTLAELATTDGDYAPLQVNASGALYIAGAVTTSGTVTEASAAAIAADLNELTAAPVAKTPTFLAAVIIGAPGTPGALAADGTFFTVATLQAGRAAAANASLITIGGNTAYTTQRATELAPGDTWTLTPPAGTKWDLNDFYIDGVNTDDGVRIMYVAP